MTEGGVGKNEGGGTRTCIGYGAMEGKCENEAGTPWTPYWCLPCDEERRATITADLQGIVEAFADRERRWAGGDG